MRSNELGTLYAPGQPIVREGELGDCMYVVQSGTVEVVKTTSSGERCVGVLSDGDFFGEMAIFEHEARSATVRALGEARVLKVDKRTLLRRMKEDPTLAFNILETMSHRLRNVTSAAASDERAAT